VSAIIVIAKAPVPGRVKTRLCPPLDPREAARVAEAALGDTLQAVAAAGPARRVVALDGAPGRWLPKEFEVIPQRGEGLAERIATAFEDVAEPAVLIGMDTPQVSPRLITDAIHAIRRPGRAVFGAAVDGGWWAVGLHRPDRRAFIGIPMSTRSTGVIQRARLRAIGLSIRELPALRDIDRIDDAVLVARRMKGSRLAAALAKCLDGRRTEDAAHACGWDAVHTSASLPSRTVVRLHDEDLDSTIELRSDRWHEPPAEEEEEILNRLTPPVLDVGCGPGRHVKALAERGVMAMGIDVSPTAVGTARSRGIPVLRRSVFEQLPGAGRWGSALVVDGSIGIGGEPVLLLRRLSALVRPGGSVVVELQPPRTPSRRLLVRVDHGGGHVGGRFPWAEVSTDAVGAAAEAAGLRVREVWASRSRWFAHLVSPTGR
jgi:rSAM/selenodomain-associated transferase 1